MGRRGGMRGRPGLLFIAVLAVCLVIFYLSWRSMSSPDFKPLDKDVYSVPKQRLHDKSQWEIQKASNPIAFEKEDRGRDPDYDLPETLDKEYTSQKQGNEPLTQKYEKPDDSESKPYSNIIKPQPSAVHPSEEKQLQSKKYYRDPDRAISETLNAMDRFVHLDLKGAAPQMSYLRTFIPLAKSLGATGLLIEYEDTFPYTGMLKYVGAANAYSKENVEEILSLAKKADLKVMPLIQTFGHMEFVLKSDYSYLRESEYTPQVIDITNNASYGLISEMVKQILDAHPDATHIHIGCDEVYELGRGKSALLRMDESDMFLQHVTRVADIVRNHRGNIIPVIWDDELRHLATETILKSKLSTKVEIMVWQYSLNVLEKINATVWEKYGKIFKSVWIASSFKGATGVRQFFTEPEYHIQNHFSWLDIIALTKDKVTFKGVAMTGWQRYDHFATLCELLPVAIPSLAVCLATMMNGGFTESAHWKTSVLLNCSRNVEMSFPSIDKKTKRAMVTQDCRFPGHELYHAMQEFYGHYKRSEYIQHRLDGWLTGYHIARGFSSPGQLKVLSKQLQEQSAGFSSVSRPLIRSLSNIYSNETVEEWMEENVLERQNQIQELQQRISELQQQKTWGRRPLPNVNLKASEKPNFAENKGIIKQSFVNSQNPNYAGNGINYNYPKSTMRPRQIGIEKSDAVLKSPTGNQNFNSVSLHESEVKHAFSGGLKSPKLNDKDRYFASSQRGQKRQSDLPDWQNFNDRLRYDSDKRTDIDDKKPYEQANSEAEKIEQQASLLQRERGSNTLKELKPTKLSANEGDRKERLNFANMNEKLKNQIEQEDTLRRGKYVTEKEGKQQTQQQSGNIFSVQGDDVNMKQHLDFINKGKSPKTPLLVDEIDHIKVNNIPPKKTSKKEKDFDWGIASDSKWEDLIPKSNLRINGDKDTLMRESNNRWKDFDPNKNFDHKEEHPTSEVNDKQMVEYEKRLMKDMA